MISRSIDHINISVPHMEKALDFYTNTLGFTIKERYTGAGMDFVFITDGSTVYELLENTALEKAKIDHIAYISEDIEADYAHFKNKDASMLLGEVGFVDFLFENGVYYFFIQGPGQEKIEFCQKKMA